MRADGTKTAILSAHSEHHLVLSRRDYMITYFIAFCLGGFFGVATMCMCFAAGEEDRRNGCYDEKEDGEE